MERVKDRILLLFLLFHVQSEATEKCKQSYHTRWFMLLKASSGCFEVDTRERMGEEQKQWHKSDKAVHAEEGVPQTCGSKDMRILNGQRSVCPADGL